MIIHICFLFFFCADMCIYVSSVESHCSLLPSLKVHGVLCCLFTFVWSTLCVCICKHVYGSTMLFPLFSFMYLIM